MCRTAAKDLQRTLSSPCRLPCLTGEGRWGVCSLKKELLQTLKKVAFSKLCFSRCKKHLMYTFICCSPKELELNTRQRHLVVTNRDFFYTNVIPERTITNFIVIYYSCLCLCLTFTVQDGVLGVGADVGFEERTLVLQPTGEASPWKQAERGHACQGREINMFTEHRHQCAPRTTQENDTRWRSSE